MPSVLLTRTSAPMYLRLATAKRSLSSSSREKALMTRAPLMLSLTMLLMLAFSTHRRWCSRCHRRSMTLNTAKISGVAPTTTSVSFQLMTSMMARMPISVSPLVMT